MTATTDPPTRPIADPPVGWPLPGTQLPQAHLSWEEWVIRRSKELPAVSLWATRPTSGAADSLRYLEPNAPLPTMPSWPLPATSLPGFQLSWAAWVERLSGASSRRPSQASQQPSRAA